jgi:hypothetical protein
MRRVSPALTCSIEQLARQDHQVVDESLSGHSRARGAARPGGGQPVGSASARTWRRMPARNSPPSSARSRAGSGAIPGAVRSVQPTTAPIGSVQAARARNFEVCPSKAIWIKVREMRRGPAPCRGSAARSVADACKGHCGQTAAAAHRSSPGLLLDDADAQQVSAERGNAHRVPAPSAGPRASESGQSRS